jgi:hypothetical protein
MRFGDDIREVRVGLAVCVAIQRSRSHCDLSGEPAELGAVLRRIEEFASIKVENFPEASLEARQNRG